MWAQEKGEGRTRSHAPQVVSGGPLVGLRGHRGTRTQMASGCGTDIGAAAGGAPVGTRERRGRAAVGSVCRPIRAGAPGAQTRPYQRPTRGQPVWVRYPELLSVQRRGGVNSPEISDCMH